MQGKQARRKEKKQACVVEGTQRKKTINSINTKHLNKITKLSKLSSGKNNVKEL
jgi:hypothetical protein